jgi:arylsulfatase A-like enzyme
MFKPFENLVVCLSWLWAWICYEWLFNITKPSFLSSLSVSEASATVISTLAVVTFVVGVPLVLVFSAIRFMSCRVSDLLLRFLLGLTVTLFIFSVIDDFLYTTINFGILSVFGPKKYIHLLLFLACFFFVTISQRGFRTISFVGQDRAYESLRIMLLVGTLLGLALLDFDNVSVRNQPTAIPAARPNIFLVGIDGINVSDVSTKNTPFLSSLLSNSLFFANTYANTGSTLGSSVALLTGYHPLQSKVFHFPDTLPARLSTNHLLAILRSIGYKLFQASMRSYADGFDANIHNAFHSSNGRNTAYFESPVTSLCEACVGTPPYLLLLSVVDRIVNRIGYALSLYPNDNPYAFVTDPLVDSAKDDRNLQNLKSFIDTHTNEPIFAQIHFLGTHGPQYFGKLRINGNDQSQNRQQTFFDALYSIDTLIAEFITFLRVRNQLGNSVLIIYSDHGRERVVGETVPLVIYAPFLHTSAEKKFTNTQLIDVAPTILEILGVPQPNWMEGSSLLSPISEDRPLLVVQSRALERIRYRSYPLLNIGQVAWIECNQISKIDLDTGKMEFSVNDSANCHASTERESFLRIAMRIAHYGLNARVLEQGIRSLKNPDDDSNAVK